MGVELNHEMTLQYYKVVQAWSNGMLAVGDEKALMS
jgi:hypothetical protein